MPYLLSGLDRHRPLFSASRLCAAAWLAAIALMGPAISAAQTDAKTAAVSTTVTAGFVTGQVQDETGAIVPNAHVELRRADGSLVATGESNMAGQFRLTQPAAGEYQLSVALNGFEPALRTVRVGRAALAAMTVTLKVASLATTVVVNAGEATDVAAPDQNQDTPSISSNDMKTLPMLDNDVVATLSALLDAGAAGEGGATLMVDGVEMKNVGVSTSAIERVSINQDPYSAQYRQPGRGQVEVITKSTADHFHGAVTFYFRDSALNATNYFAKVKPPDQRRVYDGYLTGPISFVKNTSFLFSMNRQEDDYSQAVNATVPDTANPANTAGVLFTQNVSAPTRNTWLTMKVAHQISDRQSAYLMYRFRDGNRQNQGVGSLTLPEAGYASYNFDMDLTFHHDMIVSANKLNQFNILFERNIDRTVSNNQAIGISVPGSFTGGGAQADQLQTENNPNISDIFSWTPGDQGKKRHQLKFGVQFPNIGRRILEDETNRQGVYTFGTLANCTPASITDTHCSPLAAYVQGIPTTFAIQEGETRFLTHFIQPGAFFMDQIQVTDRLTVTPGVRYDFQNALPNTKNAILPRLSLAYLVDKKHALVVRTGAGIYMRRVGVNIGQQLARYEHAAERSLLLNTNVCYHPGIQTYCGPLAAQPPNLFNFAPGLQAPMQAYFGMSVERQLTKKSTVTVGYNGYRGWHALRSVDVNAPLPPFTSAVRPDLNYGQILQQQSGGYQKSDDLSVTFRGRLTNAFSGYVQYDYSHADANTEFSTFIPQNQYAPNAEWSRTNFDQRHRFNLFGTFYPDKPLNLGIGFYDYTGSPYTITTGTDDFHTGVLNARPVGIARNSLQSGDYQDLEFRLGYTYKLRPRLKDASPTVAFSVSSFNTLNRVNYSGYVGVISSPNFRQPTSADDPRRLQVGAAYNF